jgi:hypothetical protein
MGRFSYHKFDQNGCIIDSVLTQIAQLHELIDSFFAFESVI